MGDYQYRFALLTMVIGTFIFVMALHNIDQSHNMSYLADNGIYLVDQSAFGGILYTKDDLYRNGVMMLIAGFLVSMASAIYLTYERKKKPANEPDVWGF
jgi:hypothetical protein